MEYIFSAARGRPLNSLCRQVSDCACAKCHRKVCLPKVVPLLRSLDQSTRRQNHVLCGTFKFDSVVDIVSHRWISSFFAANGVKPNRPILSISYWQQIWNSLSCFYFVQNAPQYSCRVMKICSLFWWNMPKKCHHLLPFQTKKAKFSWGGPPKHSLREGTPLPHPPRTGRWPVPWPFAPQSNSPKKNYPYAVISS